MLIVTISKTNRHFKLVDARSRSQLHMAGAFFTFSDCLVFFFLFISFFFQILPVRKAYLDIQLF